MTVVGIDLFLSKVYWCLIGGGIWNDLFEFLQSQIRIIFLGQHGILGSSGVWSYQVVKDTFVKLELVGPALPELLVVVIKAGPVFTEFGEAVCVDVFEPVGEMSVL